VVDMNHVVLKRVCDTSGYPRMKAQVKDALVEAADRFGTPVYVMDMIAVAAAARQVEAAFGSPWLLHYSLKANDLPAIAGYLASRGWGGAVVSTGEWQHARHGGLANQNVVFEGIGKTDAQLGYAAAEAAVGRPPRWLVIESAEELSCLADLAARYQLGRGRRPAIDVLLRLNPAVDPETRREFAVGSPASKFGLPDAEIRTLARSAAADCPGLTVRGIHVHVGSALTDVGAWAVAGLRATRLLADIARYCPRADTVDYGGGFPLPRPGSPGPADFREALRDALAEAGLSLPPRPAIEPGRYLVGGAGWLVSRVLHVRKQPQPDAPEPRVILDAGMTELMRPALYGSLHRVHALQAGVQALRPTAVDGPVCEMTDSFGTHQLPPLARGDLVAIEEAGAYAASFTSRYNGRPHPAEALLWHGGELEEGERPALQAGGSGGRDERQPSAETSLV
jgi:diaminopimelate decarboxylase